MALPGFEDNQSAAGEYYVLGDAKLHLAAIVNSSDDAIISKDLAGTIVSWNAGARRMFGYEPHEIVGRSILTLIPEELHHEEVEIMARLRAGQRIEHFETIRMRKNGDRFPLSVTISPIRDEQGKVIGASKIARDISERRKISEDRYRLAAIVESADDAIVSKDLNGIVQTWNEGARKLFGYTAEEMIGSPVLKLIPEDLQYEEEDILRKLRAGERIDHYETTRRKKSGERFEVSVTISPIRDDKGRVIGASKIARDISERRRLERLLIQSEKLVATGRMAATIAHEINNPLESLINLIYLARASTPADSEGYQFLMTAEQEIERVSHLARQTLGFYKESGVPEEQRMDELLDRVLMVYRTKLAGSSIEVVRSYAARGTILVSKGEMIQVFSNIVANSIDAMTAGGTLCVETAPARGERGDGIQVKIADTGPGIPEETLPRIFEPFFTTKGNLGTGVGLWVARQLLEARGGTISVSSSQAEGASGTAITIFLPYDTVPQIEDLSRKSVPVL